MKPWAPHPRPNKGRSPGPSSLILYWQPRCAAPAVPCTFQDLWVTNLVFSKSSDVCCWGGSCSHNKNHSGWSSLNFGSGQGNVCGAPTRSTAQVRSCRAFWIVTSPSTGWDWHRTAGPWLSLKMLLPFEQQSSLPGIYLMDINTKMMS